jgi:hypothetical protein
VSRLEAVRLGRGISDEEFFLHVLTHPEMTRRILRAHYEELCEIKPNSSWRERMHLVLLNRLILSWVQGDEIFGLREEPDEQRRDEMVHAVVAKYRSPDDLISAIIDYEEAKHKPPTPPGSEDAVAAVTRILAEPM